MNQHFIKNIQVMQVDITTLAVDAIVNAANSSLLGGGGVDGAIHKAAGPKLKEYCRSLGGCQSGKAKITPGFNLPARYVIHTVGPIWGQGDEEKLLSACYRNAMALAAEYACKCIAFPAISTGAYGYPADLAAMVAVQEIVRSLEEMNCQIEVILTCRSDDSCKYLHDALIQVSGSNRSVQ